MQRFVVALAVALAAVSLVAAGCGGDDEESAPDTETTTETSPGPTSTAAFQGSVGPGFDIVLTADGVPVTTWTAGDQLLEVQDNSGQHNFHLTGPGVDVSTSVAEEGTEEFSITLEPGTYEFFCDPHRSSMNGSFEVTS
jgi:hypothetical protein